MKLMPEVSRRRFLSGGASLGALTLLTGCEVSDSLSAENMLTQMSKFNDAVQAAMFNPNALAPTYPASAITRPFPFNAYYTLDDAPEIEAKDWELEVTGLVQNTKAWKLEELYALPQETQITRHICVEGWSAIGSWTGARLSEFLKRVGADTARKICLVPLRRGLHHLDRHADRAASADADDVRVRRQDRCRRPMAIR